MKKEQFLAAALLVFGFSTAAHAELMSYRCDQDRKIDVVYSFNSAGVPTKAEVMIQGKKRVLNYNMDRSDNVGSFFNDKAGYELSSNIITRDDYHSSSIMIMSPKSEILFKNCSAAMSTIQPVMSEDAPSVDANVVTSVKQANYICQQGKKMKVEYGFNEVGIPVYALVNFKGTKLKLPYDLDQSSEASTFFTKDGYVFAGDGMTVDTYRNSFMMLTAPSNEILYKMCKAR